METITTKFSIGDKVSFQKTGTHIGTIAKIKAIIVEKDNVIYEAIAYDIQTKDFIIYDVDEQYVTML